MATQNIQLTTAATGTINWDKILNSNFTIIDAVFGSSHNISVSGLDVSLTVEDTQFLRINLSGSVGTADVNVIFPDRIGGSWIVSNNASSTGGSIFLRGYNYTIPPIKIDAGGSIFVFSDGMNIYSATSGAAGGYLPLTGGNISGDLGVNKTLQVGGLATFQNGLTVTSGTTTVNNLKLNGGLDLTGSNLSVKTETIGGANLVGNQVLGVAGPSGFTGDISLAGNLLLSTGGIIVNAPAAANTFYGNTTVPSGASFTLKSGSTFTVENGATLAFDGPFKPITISTGDITSSSKIAITGAGGLNSGSGGIVCPGPLSVSGKASFAESATFNSTVQMNVGFDAPGISILRQCNIQPLTTGYATLRWMPDVNISGVLTCTTETKVRFGMFNEKVPGLALGAWLDMTNGKWTATGGIGVAISSLPSGSAMTSIPGVTYDVDGGSQCVDLGLVVEHLLDRINHLTSELEAIKNR